MRHLAALAALGAVVAALLVLGIAGGDDDHTVQAEFSNARGLVEGNEVRVAGAPAGSVESIELTDRGAALVTLSLHEGLARPRADAVAAIRPVDLLGDIYVSLSPGRSPRPLRGPIDTAHTSNAPRLDQLLTTFQPAQRAGLTATLVALGRALDRRGGEVNRAATELRPALEATDELLRELASQRTDLRRVVADAERATSQLAPRDRDLRRTVDGLAGTLRATAARPSDLDAGLAHAPATLAQLRETSNRLARSARALRPLAAELRDAAPGLTTAAGRLGPFLRKATPAAEALRPTARRLTSVLRASSPAVPDLRRGLDSLRASAPTLARAADLVSQAAPGISDGFFVNFPDEAAEPGRGVYPNAAERHYWRGAGVVSCETFGVPIRPGCIFDVLTQFLPRGADGRRSALLDLLLDP